MSPTIRARELSIEKYLADDVCGTEMIGVKFMQRGIRCQSITSVISTPLSYMTRREVSTGREICLLIHLRGLN